MVTQKQIASKLGINQSTVSAALNDIYHKNGMRISEEKRNYIKQTALEMGYRVDDLARSIKTGKTKMIGIVYSGFNARLFEAMTEALDPSDYTIKLLPVITHNRSGMQKILNKIEQKRLGGVIIHYSIPCVDLLISELQKRNISFLLSLEKEKVSSGASSIFSDNIAGGRLAAEHLYGLGHRNFLCIGMSKDNYISNMRISAFCNRLKEKGCHIPEENILRGHEEDSRREQKNKLYTHLNSSHRPTAIFTTTPGLAVIAQTVIGDMKLNIPRDFSLLAYGDSHLAAQVAVPISCIDEKDDDMGRQIAQSIVNMIENKNGGNFTMRYDVELIRRESTAAPA